MLKKTAVLMVFMFLCIATYAEASQTVIFNSEYANSPQEKRVATQIVLPCFDVWRNSAGYWTDTIRDGIPDVPVEEGGPDVFVKVIKPSIWRFPGAFLENYIPTRAVVRMGPVSEADYDNAYKAYKTLGKDYWHLVRWTNSWNRYEKIVGRYYPAEWKVGHVRNRFDSKGTQHS